MFETKGVGGGGEGEKGVGGGKGGIISRNISQPWTTIRPKQCSRLCPLVIIVYHTILQREKGDRNTGRKTY